MAEILQYKQYHAENTPPFPEDIHAARWVLNYAEPNGLVDKTNQIVVDNTPLIRGGESEGVLGVLQVATIDKTEEVQEEEVVEKQVDQVNFSFGQKKPPSSLSSTDLNAASKGRKKISIKSRKKAGPKKIVINKK